MGIENHNHFNRLTPTELSNSSFGQKYSKKEKKTVTRPLIIRQNEQETATWKNASPPEFTNIDSSTQWTGKKISL